MTAPEPSREALLERVAERIRGTPCSTDRLMLTRWRVLSLCQRLLGGADREVEDACEAALEAFAVLGAGPACDKALEIARGVAGGAATSVLPSISTGKRGEVAARIDALAEGGPAAIEAALRALAGVRERMADSSSDMSLPGVRHRLELVASALTDESLSAAVRARAAAAVLYVEEVRDVIPDTLGAIGMADDDYALRIVLDDLSPARGSAVHWSEEIASLWDDVPFLQGMDLMRGDSPIRVTWVDRANSYVAHSHVLGGVRDALVLLQPTVACSPLHTIVSLIGLIVLDGVTSSRKEAYTLREGRTYLFDGCTVRYEGVATAPAAGWLRLRMRDGVVYQPPRVAGRMVPIDGGRLSPLRDFSSRPKSPSADPVQRFFGWDAVIGSASLQSQLVLVSSRRRALDLMDGVHSNGVHLLEHGLVRFESEDPTDPEIRGSLIVVVPSLAAARRLVDRGVRAQTVFVDGYERLHRGRHEIPFISARRDPPSVVAWCAAAYYPTAPPSWLLHVRHVEATAQDLARVLELDAACGDVSNDALRLAAEGPIVTTRVNAKPAAEVAVRDAVDAYLHAVRHARDLPEYWRYHLSSSAAALRDLVASTPAEWSTIKRFAASWSLSTDEKWSSLRAHAAVALSGIRDAERLVISLIDSVSETVNSTATALERFSAEAAGGGRQWHFVCARPEQVAATTSFLASRGTQWLAAVPLRDLAACSDCVVAGWMGGSFARRLCAHVPRALAVLGDGGDCEKWHRLRDAPSRDDTQSLLAAVGGQQSRTSSSAAAAAVEQGAALDEVTLMTEGRVPCVFVWLEDRADAKVLAADSRVVIEEGDAIREIAAARLRSGNRVILSLTADRWSPADEFTGALIVAVGQTHPEVATTAREWRVALRRLRDARGLSTANLRALLASAGVGRESQTIEGWLDAEAAAPIAPRALRREISAMWSVIGSHAERALDEVVSACARLRALRAEAGRALMKPRRGVGPQDAGAGETWFDDLVARLRNRVRACEVAEVTTGAVPSAMLGWWISSAAAARYESTSAQHERPPESPGEDDGDE